MEEEGRSWHVSSIFGTWKIPEKPREFEIIVAAGGAIREADFFKRRGFAEENGWEKIRVREVKGEG